MVTEISAATRTEVLRAIRSRYRAALKRDKSRMLDEFVAMTGCHRKHAVRLLGQHERSTGYGVPKGRRIYDEAVRQALIIVWEASDRICGKRLKAALPSMVESLERHGHLDLNSNVQERVFSGSVCFWCGFVAHPWSRRLRHPHLEPKRQEIEIVAVVQGAAAEIHGRPGPYRGWTEAGSTSG